MWAEKLKNLDSESCKFSILTQLCAFWLCSVIHTAEFFEKFCLLLTPRCHSPFLSVSNIHDWTEIMGFWDCILDKNEPEFKDDIVLTSLHWSSGGCFPVSFSLNCAERTSVISIVGTWRRGRKSREGGGGVAVPSWLSVSEDGIPVASRRTLFVGGGGAWHGPTPRLSLSFVLVNQLHAGTPSSWWPCCINTRAL